MLMYVDLCVSAASVSMTPQGSVTSEVKVKRSNSDDEEKWLDALEAGTLDDFGELPKTRDPALLTTRQVQWAVRECLAGSAHLSGSRSVVFLYGLSSQREHDLIRCLFLTLKANISTLQTQMHTSKYRHKSTSETQIHTSDTNPHFRHKSTYFRHKSTL
eukprot:TRINITY_DN36491_c0_g1_i2.p1 TRINITY_DN36491_c0_g1~~TRINITY_DN36491_c0_g1_i2.p1  ORF type:complete len:159 (+),score=28.40 TRINITY_DN36491_c0_g1_i2:142-618(+)